MKRKFIVKVGDKTFPVEVEEVQERSEQVQVARPVVTEPRPHTAESVKVPQERVEAVAGAVQAPLPGKVLSIKCRVGDSVNVGDTILILESMKMENAIMAPKSGRVKEIPVAEGATVELGEVLLVIE